MCTEIYKYIHLSLSLSIYICIYICMAYCALAGMLSVSAVTCRLGYVTHFCFSQEARQADHLSKVGAC